MTVTARWLVERCLPEDARAVRALAEAAQLDVDPFRELALSHAILLVARARPGDPPLAFALAWQVADEVELLDIAAHQEHRRRGLAHALLEALFEEAHRKHMSAIFLEVRPSNEAARALYRATGFSEVGRRPRYYGDGEDALLLRRDL